MYSDDCEVSRPRLSVRLLKPAAPSSGPRMTCSAPPTSAYNNPFSELVSPSRSCDTKELSKADSHRAQDEVVELAPEQRIEAERRRQSTFDLQPVVAARDLRRDRRQRAH